MILVPVASTVGLAASALTGVLDPAGPVGAAQKTILINSVLIMLAIVVPVILATLGFAWWFRSSNRRAAYRPDWAYSGRIELVTWSIPVLVVVFLGGIAWIGSHDLDPAKPLDTPAPPLDVQVVSLDWKWLFILPEQGVAAVNELVVPTKRPIRFSLTSASVMNAFFVPELGSMIYTMNGMATRLNLQADREGSYRGISAHFSGDGFPGMHFQVRAVDAAGFEAWVKGAQGGRALDREAYEAFAKPSLGVAPATFRLAAPDLFMQIVHGTIPPAPGPAPSVSPKAPAATPATSTPATGG